MRSSNSNYHGRAVTETERDEPENSVQNSARLVPALSPIEQSFYESYIIQSRTEVENLYASNVLSSQKHVKEVRDLARQRKVKLQSFEHEEKKFVKRMEKLKLKQAEVNFKRLTTNEHDAIDPRKKRTGENMRSKLPSLNKASTQADGNDTNESKHVKTLARLSLPRNTLSKSCNDLKSLCENSTRRSSTHLTLPDIRNITFSRSLENVSDSPFVTHLSLKVRNDPHSTSSRQYDKSQCKEPITCWNEKKVNGDPSTKVKWVPKC